MDQSAIIYEHLGRVKDPEIPVMSLHDMGILREVTILSKEDNRYSKALEQFKNISRNFNDILLEPTSKNTAPAILAASIFLNIKKKN